MTTKKPAPDKEPPKKKKSFLQRMLTLLLVAVFVLGAAALTTMEDGKHFTALRRWLMYGEGSATKDVYSYAPNTANRYGTLGDSLLVVSPNSAQLLQDDGSIIYDLSIQTTNPQLSIGKNLAAVCDVGGGTVYLLDGTGIQRTLRKEGELCYYSARLNSSDYLAVIEQKNGYKASAAVYDSAGELLFSFDSYDNYLSDAIVTADGRYLTAVSLEPDNGIFASCLRVYDLLNGELKSSTSIRDGLVLELAANGRRILSLCDKRFTITTMEGEILLDQAYGNLYLNDCALGGKDFCALLLGRYQAGNISTLMTYDMNGKAIASLDLTEEVLDISAAGSCLAVLFDESLVVYDRELTERARLEDTNYAAQVRVQDDGSVLMISGASAWSFLP
ncbi:MAG: hypothetical protein HFF69_03680 [Oscillospiraceae bacterium]|nr:hypothetical protein [Oscillospiraceae bacterium]